MSDAKLTINGLTELREALKKLPPELVRDAGVLVQAEAEAAAQQITAAYPTGPTGNLKAHVVVELASDAVSARARVKSTAKHAHIYEYGTASRRWANGKSTGRMPVGGVFVPIVIARRRVLVAALIELVERAGLKVTAAEAFTVRITGDTPCPHLQHPSTTPALMGKRASSRSR